MSSLETLINSESKAFNVQSLTTRVESCCSPDDLQNRDLEQILKRFPTLFDMWEKFSGMVINCCDQQNKNPQ